MNITKILLSVYFIIFLMGCSPEVGTPEDFQKQMKLIEKGELVPKEELIRWLGV